MNRFISLQHARTPEKLTSKFTSTSINQLSHPTLLSTDFLPSSLNIMHPMHIHQFAARTHRSITSITSIIIIDSQGFVGTSRLWSRRLLVLKAIFRSHIWSMLATASWRRQCTKPLPTGPMCSNALVLLFVTLQDN